MNTKNASKCDSSSAQPKSNYKEAEETNDRHESIKMKEKVKYLVAPNKPRGKPRAPHISNGDTAQSCPEYITVFKNAVEDAVTSQLNSINEAFKKVVDALESKIEKNEKELDAKDRVIEGLKKATMRHAAETGFNGEPDNVVQDNLKKHMADVKTWCKKYGISQKANSIPHSSKTCVTTALTAGPVPSTSHLALSLALEQSLSATTILNALVNKHLFDRFFENPFFFLQNVTLHGEPSDVMKSILDIVELGTSINSDRVKVWFSHTMALFQEASNHVKDKHSHKKSMVHDLKEQQYVRFVEDFFIDNAVCTLLVELNANQMNKRKIEFYNIASAFGEYLQKLATHKVKMRRFDYNDVKGGLFRRDSQELKPHPSLHLDDDETSCDGKPLLLVVEPGIRAFGDEDGRNYDQHKVWQPTTVIVERVTFEQGASPDERMVDTKLNHTDSASLWTKVDDNDENDENAMDAQSTKCTEKPKMKGSSMSHSKSSTSTRSLEPLSKDIGSKDHNISNQNTALEQDETHKPMPTVSKEGGKKLISVDPPPPPVQRGRSHQTPLADVYSSISKETNNRQSGKRKSQEELVQGSKKKSRCKAKQDDVQECDSGHLDKVKPEPINERLASQAQTSADPTDVSQHQVSIKDEQSEAPETQTQTQSQIKTEPKTFVEPSDITTQGDCEWVENTQRQEDSAQIDAPTVETDVMDNTAMEMVTSPHDPQVSNSQPLDSNHDSDLEITGVREVNTTSPGSLSQTHTEIEPAKQESRPVKCHFH